MATEPRLERVKRVFTHEDWVEYREQRIADILAEYDNVDMVNLRKAVAEEIYETPYGQSEELAAALRAEQEPR